MVDQEFLWTLQAVSAVATALGVCIAATYYVVTLRINQRALRINMTNNLLQQQTSPENIMRLSELLNMKWSSYDEFEEKYGSDNNIDNHANRLAIWNIYNIIGRQLKAGFLDRETIYQIGPSGVVWTWTKFRSVIEEYRRRSFGSDAWDGFEYLADEMLKMKLQKDPNYRIPERYAKFVQDK
ncbi:hypothetical protein FJY84_00130 [Candidatus Bathyarchaeota archaeon]|nr:hypothetical protein [Candidatus Bathyarchaeota archaeon]